MSPPARCVGKQSDFRKPLSVVTLGQGGVQRLHFVFSDSLQVGGYLGPSHGEGKIEESMTMANLAVLLPTKYFAGIVCVAD